MRAPTSRPVPGRLAWIALALLGGACASTEATRSGRQRVAAHIEHGRFREGLELAEELAQRAPDDAELAELHVQAQVASLLDAGRRASFAGYDEEALLLFERALGLDPDSPQARQWIEKTRLKLADLWLDVARNFRVANRIAEAADAYRTTLQYVPGYQPALTGLGELDELLAYREDRGEDYYDEGVRSLADYWLRSSRREFAAAGKYLPEDTRSPMRQEQVESLIAEQRVVIGQDLMARELYAAAAREFAGALELDAENEAAAAAVGPARLEAAVAELLDEADTLILRERFADARAKLDQADELTRLQGAKVAAVRDRVDESQLELRYQDALVLEHDYRYEEAIDAYDRILQRVDYYQDVRARRDQLQDYLEWAPRWYEEAQAAQDVTERLEKLRAIEVIWPEYRDVQEQLERIQDPDGGVADS